MLSSKYKGGAYDSKSNDEANFTPFKLNWYMIRTACTEFNQRTPKLKAEQYRMADVLSLNTPDSLQKAIKCLRDTQRVYGAKWWATQRAGQTGFELPDGTDTPTIRWKEYQKAVGLIDQGLTGHLTDDFSVHYPVEELRSNANGLYRTNNNLQG